jgi:hypothetical protein
MSKARKTGDVFDEQDALGRTYASANDPHMDADKKRLGDTWLIEEAEGSAEVSRLAEKKTEELSNLVGAPPVELTRLPPKKKRSLNKYTRYHHKKEY